MHRDLAQRNLQGSQAAGIGRQATAVGAAIMGHDIARQYGCSSTQARLKQLCKEKCLVQSGNKDDQVLRLLFHEMGTRTAKRAANTEMIVQ